MKKTIIFFIIFITSSNASADGCQESIAANFKFNWENYYAAALVKHGEEMGQFFKFPLKLLGMYDEDKPTIINRKFFLKNYSLIFIKNKVTKNTVFYTSFSKWKNEKITESDLSRIKLFCDGSDKQRLSIRKGDLIFEWFPRSGWKITEIYYNSDDKEYLFSSINPYMEYAFP